MLTVGSLFSGIGGIDLGLERAGMTVKWHSEIDPYACRVLKKHWPDVPNLGDITQVNWENVPHVDVIAGGYPCQPFSLAGNRNGATDPRHLWPYFRNAISRIRPHYALLENVRGHLTMGGTAVIADLTAIGYDCEWRVISAASVGANHKRDRLIIVAYPQGRNGRNAQSHGVFATGRQAAESREPHSLSRAVSDWWQTEPGMGRVADGVPHRVDRLRGLGNAVVPQVAEVVGRLIVSHAND